MALANPASRDNGRVDEPGRVNRLYAVLTKVNEAIIRLRDRQKLIEEACRIAVEDGQFLLAWIGFVEPGEQFIRSAARYGRDEGYLDAIRISISEDVPEGQGPTGISWREGRTFINNDTEHNPIMWPWREEQLKRGYRSSASFPLRAEGKIVGVFALYAGEPNYFDDEETQLLECLADDFSFALESAEVARQRAQALEELRKSHDELEERVKERTAVLESLFEERSRQAEYAEALNRINESLHSTLDFDEIMQRVVVKITEALQVGAAVVQVHRENYWEFAYEHGLPQELRHVRLPDAEVPLSMTVMETCRPVVVNDVANDERVNPAVMERFGITALMAVPLIIRGEVFGVLIADRFDEPAPFTEQQVDFLQKAAATLALALENARVYEKEHEIADRLQSAMLTMPDIVPGIDFAHSYHSAAQSSRVGGDFYDLFELSAGQVGVLIGDVAGKGLNAAVLTSLVKNTIRAHANEVGKTPAQILALTNDVVFKATSMESFVTVFFGILECDDGTLVYANAGHPAGALIRDDGSMGTLPSTGPLLGALDDARFGQSEAHVEPGDLLFLYTDGLTEARRGGEFYGEERLLAFLASSPGRRAADVVRDLVGDVISFSKGRLTDDAAILALSQAFPSAR